MRAYPALLSLDSPHWISYLKENLKAPQRPTTILDREHAVPHSSFKGSGSPWDYFPRSAHLEP